MIEQESIPGWSDTDEADLQRLLKKRLHLRRGTKGHDLRFTADMLAGEAGERHVVAAMSTAEVKTIKEVSRNGKVFIEYENYSKPSGISTTDADFWVIVLDGKEYGGEVFVGIKTERLRKLAAPLSYDPPCGSHKASVGVRLAVSDLLLPNYRIYE